MERLNRNRTFNIVSKSDYPKELQNFALTMLYYSPKAYEYMGTKFDKALPASKTIRRWLTSIDNGPGYSYAAMQFLKLKCQSPKFFCLTVDEVALTPKIEILPDGKYCGYEDLGMYLRLSIFFSQINYFENLQVMVSSHRRRPKKRGFTC